MALITIFKDGSFLREGSEEAIAAVGKNPAQIKTHINHLTTQIKEKKADLKIAERYNRLREKRVSEMNAIKKLKASKAIDATKTHKSIAAIRARVVKLDAAIKTLKSKMHGSVTVMVTLHKSIARLNKQLGSAKSKLLDVNKRVTNIGGPGIGGIGAKIPRTSAKVPTAKTPIKPKVDIGGPGIGGAGAKIPRTPRTPRDPAAAFNRQAREATNSMKREVTGTLRDHARTALVPVSLKPSAKPAPAVKTPKKADTALQHSTKPSRGAITNLVATINDIKRSIRLGGLKGAKLLRAQNELARQREALKHLRAGKTAANQKAITPVKPAARAGMGTAKPTRAELKSKAAAVELQKGKLEALQTRLKTAQVKLRVIKDPALRTIKESGIEQLKIKISRAKASLKNLTK